MGFFGSATLGSCYLLTLCRFSSFAGYVAWAITLYELFSSWLCSNYCQGLKYHETDKKVGLNWECSSRLSILSSQKKAVCQTQARQFFEFFCWGYSIWWFSFHKKRVCCLFFSVRKSSSIPSVGFSDKFFWITPIPILTILLDSNL